MIKVQKSKLIKIIRDDRQIHLRSNTHGCELIIGDFWCGWKECLISQAAHREYL